MAFSPGMGEFEQEFSTKSNAGGVVEASIWPIHTHNLFLRL